MNALILVDIQNDFLPDGPMGIVNGDAVIPVANQLIPLFDLVVATKDWHPSDHGSFAENHDANGIGDVIDLDGLPQVLWPTHCVQDSEGAEFPATLNSRVIDHVVHKGLVPNIDSYSGFFDNGRREATGLHDYLQAKNVSRVFIMGLATDYCVKFTALDARSLGYDTVIVSDGCRGVNLKPRDVEAAMAEMKAAGVVAMTSDAVKAEMQKAESRN